MTRRLINLYQWLIEVYCGARGHRWCGCPIIICSRCGANV